MPNIYDVASAIRPIRPDKAFAEGRQAAVDARRGTAYAGAIERQNQISDENAPLREKTREAKSQSIDYEMIKEKAGATKDILSGMVDEQTFQANLEQLAEIAPEMGNRLKGLSHDEAKPIVDKLLGNFDPRIAEVEELARLERLAEGGDEVSAELLAARKQLMAAQSKADMREIDQELADIEKTKAEAKDELASARERDANVAKIEKETSEGRVSETKAADSNSIYRMVVGFHGGIVDSDGNVQMLDPKKASKVAKITADAERKKEKYGLGAAESVRQALIDNGENPENLQASRPEVGEIIVVDGKKLRITNNDDPNDPEVVEVE